MQPTSGYAGQGFHRTVMGALRRRKPAIGIRMTPMIDVIFLLLTFFVLTARFNDPEQRLPIVLGAANAPVSQAVHTPLAVTLAPAGQGCRVMLADVHILLGSDDPQAGLLELSRYLQQNAHIARNRPIELYCDDAVAWDQVVKVYDVLYALGAQDITFRIEP